jgi:hypothetical protein
MSLMVVFWARVTPVAAGASRQVDVARGTGGVARVDTPWLVLVQRP